MSSKELCEIIRKRNITLTKEEINKIEDFAVKAKNEDVALTLCLYTLDVDVSKMLDVIIESKAYEHVAGFVLEYAGVLSHQNLSKLESFLEDGFPTHSGAYNIETKWVYAVGSTGNTYEVTKESFDEEIKQMRKRTRRVEKEEHDVLEK